MRTNTATSAKRVARGPSLATPSPLLDRARTTPSGLTTCTLKPLLRRTSPILHEVADLTTLGKPSSNRRLRRAAGGVHLKRTL